MVHHDSLTLSLSFSAVLAVGAVGWGDVAVEVQHTTTLSSHCPTARLPLPRATLLAGHGGEVCGDALSAPRHYVPPPPPPRVATASPPPPRQVGPGRGSGG